ncbi:MAG: putative multidrug export ATP-binding/permease protein [Promethearchaeota archaeon]|nr:MAG: putative multidrug export ATP-binding/permease protein [Candidatus Lokiarchaeota archaeon]
MLKTPERNAQPQYTEFQPTEDEFAKARERGTNRWILAHIIHGRNKYILIIVFFSTILSANLASGARVVIGDAISEFSDSNLSDITFYFILILILNVGSSLTTLMNFMLREILAQRMERDTRNEFFLNLLGKSQSFHDRQKIGDVMARATDDVRNLNFLMSPAISLILESFTQLIVPIVYIFLFYPNELLIFPLVFTVLFFITLKYYSNKIGPITRDLRNQYGEMNSTLNEILSGIEVVKATAQEETETLQYYLNAKKYKDYYVEQGRVQAKYLPILLFAITITLGFAHSLILYLDGTIRIGDIIGYVGLLSLLRFPTNISIFVFAQWRLSISSSERLIEMMEQQTEIDENKEGMAKQINGKIEFRNVTFTYPDGEKPVLKDISFVIEPNQTVAIVGTTGSGKTTLTKLLSYLYQLDKGQILIDGIDIREYSLQSLRSQISYIEQDLFLFSDTVFYNITFGRTSSLEEVKRVAKQAQADQFISELPEGYNSEIGERGVTLSGGQKQRIAIARAFLSDPRILVLDDSTSAIDSETEDKIQTAINKVMENRTTLLITHRLAQIRWSDLIIVLKKGRIAAKGTHEELLQTSEEYNKIFTKRFDIDVNQLLQEGN